MSPRLKKSHEKRGIFRCLLTLPDKRCDRTVKGLRDPARDAGQGVAVHAKRSRVPNGVLVGTGVEERDDRLV